MASNGSSSHPAAPTIVVHDTAATMRDLFALPLAERAAALPSLYAADGEAAPAAAMMLGAHASGDAFRVDRDDPRYPAALQRLVDADAWGQVREELGRAWAYQRSGTPALRFPDFVHVWLTLGYPDDALFMENTLGYYGMGGMPGVVWLVVWPTDYNITRIGACAVHEFSHQLRGANVPWRSGVGDWVVAEGLAEAFAIEVCGEGSTSGWYAAVTGEAFEAAWTTVTSALDVEGLDAAGAYVLGDPTARKMGRAPVGLPHMAGYAVGRRIVELYMAASGDTVAQAMLRPTDAILAGAGLR